MFYSTDLLTFNGLHLHVQYADVHIQIPRCPNSAANKLEAEIALCGTNLNEITVDDAAETHSIGSEINDFAELELPTNSYLSCSYNRGIAARV